MVTETTPMTDDDSPVSAELLVEEEAPTLRRGGRIRWVGSRLTGFKELVVAEPLVNLKLATITVNDSPGSALSIIKAQESEGSVRRR